MKSENKNMTLEEIASEYNLEVSDTTPEMNGYPRDIKRVITGFETIEQLNEVAEKYGLVAISVDKKDGWNIFYRGYTTEVVEPYDMLNENIGNDDTVLYEKSEKTKECLTDMLKEDISNCDTFEEVKEAYDRYDEIFDALEDAEDNEVIRVDEGRYSETFPRYSISTYDDGKLNTYGLINRD